MASERFKIQQLEIQQLETQQLEQMAAMRDASAGAFEAARVKYLALLDRLEQVSISYVMGKCDRAEVYAVSEQLIEAEFNVSENARRTRLYQESLDNASAAPASKEDRSASPPNAVPVVPQRRYFEMSIGA